MPRPSNRRRLRVSDPWHERDDYQTDDDDDENENEENEDHEDEETVSMDLHYESETEEIPPASLLQDVVVPLHPELLKKFSRLLFSESSKVFIYCTICMCDFEKDDALTILPCTHYFHRECARPWHDSHVTCPVCRHDAREPFPTAYLQNRGQAKPWAMKSLAGIVETEVRDSLYTGAEKMSAAAACPLCHEVASFAPMAQLPCGHLVHGSCLDMFLRFWAHCPHSLCHQELPVVNLCQY